MVVKGRTPPPFIALVDRTVKSVAGALDHPPVAVDFVLEPNWKNRVKEHLVEQTVQAGWAKRIWVFAQVVTNVLYESSARELASWDIGLEHPSVEGEVDVITGFVLLWRTVQVLRHRETNGAVLLGAARDDRKLAGCEGRCAALPIDPREVVLLKFVALVQTKNCTGHVVRFDSRAKVTNLDGSGGLAFAGEDADYDLAGERTALGGTHSTKSFFGDVEPSNRGLPGAPALGHAFVTVMLPFEDGIDGVGEPFNQGATWVRRYLDHAPVVIAPAERYPPNGACMLLLESVQSSFGFSSVRR